MLGFVTGVAMSIAFLAVACMVMFFGFVPKTTGSGDDAERAAHYDTFKRASLCSHYAALGGDGDEYVRLMEVGYAAGVQGRLLEEGSPLLVEEGVDEDEGVMATSSDFLMGVLFTQPLASASSEVATISSSETKFDWSGDHARSVAKRMYGLADCDEL